MQRFQIGQRVTVSGTTPSGRQFSGAKKIQNYFYDARGEHVIYGIKVGTQVLDYRATWLQLA